MKMTQPGQSYIACLVFVAISSLSLSLSLCADGTYCGLSKPDLDDLIELNAVDHWAAQGRFELG